MNYYTVMKMDASEVYTQIHNTDESSNIILSKKKSDPTEYHCVILLYKIQK